VTGAQELEQLFATSSTPLKTCPVYEQLPPEAQGSQVTATGYNDPNQQEIKMNAYVQPGSQQSNATAAFSSMNWVEAQYYGMRIAAIQNASGAYVLPSQASLDAAVAAASVNAQGILVPNYTQTKDASAYAMPSVIYAAVCSDAQSTSQATAISEMLTQLLSVSSSSTTTLPRDLSLFQAHWRPRPRQISAKTSSVVARLPCRPARVNGTGLLGLGIEFPAAVPRAEPARSPLPAPARAALPNPAARAAPPAGRHRS